MINGVQDGEIATIQQIDVNELNRIAVLEAKFPITKTTVPLNGHRATLIKLSIIIEIY